MNALPNRVPPGTGPHVTRVSCPGCSGVITIEAEGRKGHLTLTCRVGHTYSIPDLLVTKEERLEERLWEALHSLAEMAELLEDLVLYAARQGFRGAQRSFQDRAERAQTQAGLLHRIIDDNRALELHDEAARIHGDGAP